MYYKQTNITSKNGINYIRNIVEATGCLFHKIEQENDLGIDCIIEFTKNEKPVHKSIAVQIKSGKSYYDEKKNQCIIPVNSHFEYWTKYSLPVFGFIYIPQLEKAYFVNIKLHLQNNKNTNIIRFNCTRSNVIDLDSFKNIFIPSILNEIPIMDFKDAISFFCSDKLEESYLGAKVLFRRYKNNKITWDKLVGYVINANVEDIDLNVIYYLSHIPWHPDIYHYGEILNDDIRSYAKSLIKNFDQGTVLKLINLIDHEEGIVRGSIGQSIEVIISCIENIEVHLIDIIENDFIELQTKEIACSILAYYNGSYSIKTLNKLKQESEIVSNIIAFLEEYKSFDFYQ